MSEAKHNPLPWTAVLEEKFSDEIEIKAATGRVVAVIEYDDGYGQPDADLIIAAVNSHATMTADLARVTAERDRLRAACVRAANHIRAMEDEPCQCSPRAEDGRDCFCDYCTIRQAINPPT